MKNSQCTHLRYIGFRFILRKCPILTKPVSFFVFNLCYNEKELFYNYSVLCSLVYICHLSVV